jgi:hypothetical protein
MEGVELFMGEKDKRRSFRRTQEEILEEMKWAIKM